jgi:hypothetical protein
MFIQSFFVPGLAHISYYYCGSKNSDCEERVSDGKAPGEFTRKRFP